MDVRSTGIVAFACSGLVIGWAIGSMLFLPRSPVTVVTHATQITTIPERDSVTAGAALPESRARDVRVRILFVGDMMLDRTVKTRMSVADNPLYPFVKIQNMEPSFFESHDFVVGNLEGPVTATRRPPEKSIDFAFDPSVAATLRLVGFDVVSQANNHARDQGIAGAEESRVLLQAAGLGVFGDEIRDDATSSLALVERGGKTVAFLGFNTTNNPLDEDDALSAILAAKQKAAYVIVYMHWGEEYQAEPNKAQVERAHWFIDHGVDAVIGAHPHWMQSVEVYNGRPIAYSLGNFVFDQDWSTETNLGLAVGLELDGVGFMLRLFPIQIEASQPRIMAGAERASRLEHLAEISDPSLREQIQEGMIRSP